ncbi:MAG: phosphoribosylglycinamide formyltransferase [Chromatiales bacterium]|jgi:phosphoribosylglycinamide formyltransferase-1|nr:phosphoribosylglycinamide formyltransferase [Chromatiales bacterium]MDX9765848.1 phosphoribosylglycinamide formyltransferase [Ectothiorhodospiraceae bacterium]
MNIVVLISGSGSNLQAIIDAAASGELPGRIAAVISNRPEAFGLERARRAGIAAETLDHRRYPDRETFDQALMALIDRHAPDLVVLAGFMRILTPAFVRHYAGRMLNIHPSLLPEFRGLRTHERALEAGVERHGASVHFVTDELDGGPVVLQAEVPVLPDDTPERLAARVLEKEHVIYPRVVRWFCQGRLRLDGNRPLMDGRPLDRPLVLDTNEEKACA